MSPVGPRAPKDEFMRALSLDPSNPHHEGHYRAMRDEAIAAYNRINTDRSNLIEERRNDPGTQQPFFWHHIRPEVRRRAIIETWQNARAGSVQRRLFDSGATVGEHAPNWVTLWLLYSVFRSRDVRNNRTRRHENGAAAGGGVGTGAGAGGASTTAATSTTSASTSTSTSTRTGAGGCGGTGGKDRAGESLLYDPARNIYRPI